MVHNFRSFVRLPGDGTFQARPIDVGAGPTPRDPAIGDFNSDGRPDMAIHSDCCSDDVSILLHR